MTQTPEDAASDFADTVAVRELRSIRDTLTAKLREAYLAGYAHAQNVGIDPNDAAALADALNAFDRETLEALAPKHTDLRAAMRVGWIDPGDRSDVLDAAATLINKDEATVSELIGLLDDDKDIDDELASYLEDPSCVRIPYELRNVLSPGFDLHGIDTLADLSTELQWQLAVPDRSAA